MTVRAKFKVTSITQYEGSGKVTLTPVISGSEENKAFYKWTPGGSIDLQTISDSVVQEFTVGAEFYVDFTKAAP